MNNIDIWLIGASQMAIDYAKVITVLNIPFEVIGRGEESAINFENSTGKTIHKGGLEKYILSNPTIPTHAIVAVGIEQLKNTTITLLNAGVKNILIEKPGACTVDDIKEINILAKSKKANTLIAYNRRFYASVRKAEEIIKLDGGVSSFIFEFTEWSHVINEVNKNEGVKENWFIGNSTHVIDTAFFLGGNPTKVASFTADSLEWHNPAIYSGAGVTENGALFSYSANWKAPGRWSVEILTSKHRIYLKPMETLQIQEIGSIAVNCVEIDDSLDKMYKPGLFLQTSSFIKGDIERFCSTFDQQNKMETYLMKMNGK